MRGYQKLVKSLEEFGGFEVLFEGFEDGPRGTMEGSVWRWKLQLDKQGNA